MRPFVQHALAVFGPERLMFGSEWPLRLPDVTWKESLAAFTQSIGARSLEVREQLLMLSDRAPFAECFRSRLRQTHSRLRWSIRG